MHYRTALITGASSGIGAALAARLAADGTRVVLCARREPELARVAAAITARGGAADVRVLDVADADAAAAAVRAADDAVGGLDLVVANAGVGGTAATREMTWEDVRAVCRVNFDGAVATLTAVLPRMVARGRGHLVAVGSIAGFRALPASAAYSATKGGLGLFVEGLRMDLSGTGVRATCVNPGFVRTAMTDLNAFPMPFMLELDAAVEVIARRLPAAPPTIDFPFPLVAAARVSRLFPRAAVDLVARRARLR